MVESKNDMNRIGLFKEMGYATIGDEYVPSSKCKTFSSSDLVIIFFFMFQLVSMKQHIKASKCCQEVLNNE